MASRQHQPTGEVRRSASCCSSVGQTRLRYTRRCRQAAFKAPEENCVYLHTGIADAPLRAPWASRSLLLRRRRSDFPLPSAVHSPSIVSACPSTISLSRMLSKGIGERCLRKFVKQWTQRYANRDLRNTGYHHWVCTGSTDGSARNCGSLWSCIAKPAAAPAFSLPLTWDAAICARG